MMDSIKTNNLTIFDTLVDVVRSVCYLQHAERKQYFVHFAVTQISDEQKCQVNLKIPYEVHPILFELSAMKALINLSDAMEKSQNHLQGVTLSVDDTKSKKVFVLSATESGAINQVVVSNKFSVSIKNSLEIKFNCKLDGAECKTCWWTLCQLLRRLKTYNSTADLCFVIDTHELKFATKFEAECDLSKDFYTSGKWKAICLPVFGLSENQMKYHMLDSQMYHMASFYIDLNVRPRYFTSFFKSDTGKSEIFVFANTDDGLLIPNLKEIVTDILQHSALDITDIKEPDMQLIDGCKPDIVAEFKPKKSMKNLSIAMHVIFEIESVLPQKDKLKRLEEFQVGFANTDAIWGMLPLYFIDMSIKYALKDYRFRTSMIEMQSTVKLVTESICDVVKMSSNKAFRTRCFDLMEMENSHELAIELKSSLANITEERYHPEETQHEDTQWNILGIV